ncbi:hypothetical protein TNCV_4566631 [Trichonephila clavipes]|nr:hypothetical protein TNCV_4566631 [Trichonephila clavipes]
MTYRKPENCYPNHDRTISALHNWKSGYASMKLYSVSNVNGRKVSQYVWKQEVECCNELDISLHCDSVKFLHEDQ